MSEESSAKAPVDFAEFLKTQFGTMQVQGKEKSTFRMSDRNRKKLEKMKRKAAELRGQ